MQVVACLSKSVSAFYRKNNHIFGEWVDNQLQAYDMNTITVDEAALISRQALKYQRLWYLS